MTLQSAIEAELPYLRAEAERRMTDTWEIGTPGDYAYDAVRDEDVRDINVLFATKARTPPPTTQVTESEAGERTIVVSRRELHIPWNSPVVPMDAVARCTAISSTTDPTLLGAVVRITGPTPGSQMTARRLQVEEVLS